jgi:hypothetical protein
LLVVKNDIYVAAWGSFSNDDSMSAPPRHLLKVGIDSKSIGLVSARPIGNLDGLQLDGNGAFLYHPKDRPFFIPMALDGQIHGYK